MDKNTKELLKLVDGSGSDEELNALTKLRVTEGANLPGLFLEKYRTSTKANHRFACVVQSIPYSRDFEASAQLGLEALSDRSKKVRSEACSLLAASLRENLLGGLENAKKNEQDTNVLDDIEAAIDAIKNKNSNYYMDRDRSGMVVWNIKFIGGGD